ncbi:PLD nuclease N-terminal domain-containing protein [Homoserinibacter sp. YIM 151385]|uniref:PLD nuclease N-terminal domain-containing protein n=1 Tax=Homoserinibacter sp. YIM 151385 TaxID=2985506 RepID=UPI0022F113A2|nr:PLD nuclease N-terminal domain-containing protein [Homoserinibacter sp. YIM 151385]WBU37001.1 PLD nuclease N-terminal domain-containing protein [Homoserinibacter sp. YIM 151385]
MARLWAILGFISVALTIFAIVDIIMIDESRVRGLPKWAWVLICLLLGVGPILWFIIGRERLEQRQHGRYPERKRSSAPDDDPAFLERIGRDHDRDERIRDLERRLAELDEDGSGAAAAGGDAAGPGAPDGPSRGEKPDDETGGAAGGARA